MSAPDGTDPDLDLVLRAQAGDQNAFNDIVLRHQDRVLRIVKRMRQLDHAAAEDLAQETFVRAWRFLHDFRSTGEFGAWLYRIAVNVALGAVTSRRFKESRRQFSLDLTYEDGEKVRDPAEHRPTRPDRFLEQSELSRALEAALALLPEEFRTAVILCDVEGFDYERIAAILEVPVGTVRSRIHRGRERMKDFILRRHGVPSTDVEASGGGEPRPGGAP